ncbi:hypothetical protein SAMN05443665_105152 [Actinomadura meyerae]|jgi:hypothetical protein|uniref:Uncharacterized protein n=1 Tax=Actinomadura meyerae TaxID=240840 RepID=A0A239NWL4_9ACTN|nr:hypothetical protein [Actinomadura meyerae]SNT59092.1 hypothetical protein SAMN05443665_105152 [Actinomadura meyerae]
MTTNESAPGCGTGGAGDEQAAGRVVGASIRRYPVAYASLYAPAGRRRCWWFAIRCPHCNAGHFGRLRDRDALDGVRRAGCGRLVWVVVARTYGTERAA